MTDLKSEAKRVANEHGFDLKPRRKSKLDRNKRKYVNISEETYIFITAYARQHNLFVQEAADELMRIGIKNVIVKKVKPTTSGKLMKLFNRKRSVNGSSGQ